MVLKVVMLCNSDSKDAKTEERLGSVGASWVVISGEDVSRNISGWIIHT